MNQFQNRSIEYLPIVELIATFFLESSPSPSFFGSPVLLVASKALAMKMMPISATMDVIAVNIKLRLATRNLSF